MEFQLFLLKAILPPLVFVLIFSAVLFIVTALFMPKIVLAAYLIAWFVLDEG